MPRCATSHAGPMLTSAPVPLPGFKHEPAVALFWYSLFSTRAATARQARWASRTPHTSPKVLGSSRRCGRRDFRARDHSEACIDRARHGAWGDEPDRRASRLHPASPTSKRLCGRCPWWRCWKEARYCVILHLAALRSIPASLHKAAPVEGASRARVLRGVIAPLRRLATPVVAVNAVILGFPLVDRHAEQRAGQRDRRAADLDRRARFRFWEPSPPLRQPDPARDPGARRRCSSSPCSCS